MKILILLLFFSLLKFEPSHAQELFKKQSLPQSIDWLDDSHQFDFKKKTEITIMYYWATWCAPCAESTPMIIKFAKDHAKIRVIALSDEEKSLITEHLSKKKIGIKHKDYFYGMYKRSDEGTHEQLQIPALPMAFVFQNDLLVWRGNPTYPVGEFPEIVKMLLDGKLNLEELKKKSSKKEAYLFKRNEMKPKYSVPGKKSLKALNEYYEFVKTNVSNFPGQYLIVSDYFRAASNLLKASETFLGYKDSQKAKKEVEADLIEFTKNLAKNFKGQKDALTYVARDLLDLYRNGVSIDLDFIESLSNQSLELKTDVQYPDFLYFARSEIAFERGHLKKARKAIDKALKMVKGKKYEESFLSYYLDHDKKLKRFEESNCSGTFDCIKKSLF